MKTSTIGLIILILAATAGAQGTPQPAAPNHGPELQVALSNNPAGTIEEYLNPGEPIQVTPGRKFSVRIASNPTTGYGWQLAQSPDQAVAVLVTNIYVQEPTDNLRVGVGGHEVWTFQATGQGQTAIALQYLRPWEKDVPPIRTNVFTVIVK